MRMLPHEDNPMRAANTGQVGKVLRRWVVDRKCGCGRVGLWPQLALTVIKLSPNGCDAITAFEILPRVRFSFAVEQAICWTVGGLSSWIIGSNESNGSFSLDHSWILNGPWMGWQHGRRELGGSFGGHKPSVDEKKEEEKEKRCVRFAICIRECCHIQQETATTAPLRL